MQKYKSYTERVVTLSPSIMGYKCLPFSLGHSLLLKSIDSKFINGEYNSFCDINSVAEYLLSDRSLIPEFALAVLVCSTTYDDFKDECSSGGIMTAINSIKEEMKNFNLIEEIWRFAHYLHSGTQAPLYDIVNSSEDDIDINPLTPEESILATLMTDCGYNRNECLTLPLTETLSAYFVYAHKMGTIKLKSKELVELENKLKGGK